MKKTFDFIVLIALICSLTVVSGAEELPQISITAENFEVTTEPRFTADVEVTFRDMSLYNENIKLSYHLYDGEGNLLVFENPRLPLTMEGNVARMKLDVDLTAGEYSSHYKNLVVQYDLVDEENLYWAKDNQTIRVSFAQSVYDGSNWTKFKENTRFIVEEQPIQLEFSALGIGLLVFLWVKYKKAFH